MSPIDRDNYLVLHYNTKEIKKIPDLKLELNSGLITFMLLKDKLEFIGNTFPKLPKDFEYLVILDPEKHQIWLIYKYLKGEELLYFAVGEDRFLYNIKTEQLQKVNKYDSATRKLILQFNNYVI